MRRGWTVRCELVSAASGCYFERVENRELGSEWCLPSPLAGQALPSLLDRDTPVCKSTVVHDLSPSLSLSIPDAESLAPAAMGHNTR